MNSKFPSQVPDWISKPTKLKELSFTNAEFGKNKDILDRLTNLEAFELISLKERLLPTINKNSSLQKSEIKMGEVDRIPERIGNLKKS